MPRKDYSTTPLPKKLGIKEGSTVSLVGVPAGFILDLPPGARYSEGRTGGLDVAIVFVTKRKELTRRFAAQAKRLVPDGRLWVCWPKKASSVSTDLTFDVVQRTGLDAGLVDNKSASITEDFQGMQFVYRLKDRPR